MNNIKITHPLENTFCLSKIEMWCEDQGKHLEKNKIIFIESIEFVSIINFYIMYFYYVETNEKLTCYFNEKNTIDKCIKKI